MGQINRHDDIQGILGTALTGVTAYTLRQYRSTSIPLAHVANGDIFSMNFQLPHRKRKGTAIDSVHLHYIPIASANGDIKFNYTWGWYNHGDIVPSTLPNSGSITITLATTDQYKLKLANIITNLTAPASEDYSSILLCNITRVAPAGTNWGNTNEIAIVYVDAHYITDRSGSVLEYTDE
jgi:hypothetical protein